MAPIETGPDDLLTGAEVAQLLGIAKDTWRSYVNRGYAPPADDTSRPRVPRWRLDTVRRYRETRAGQGYRSDKRGGKA